MKRKSVRFFVLGLGIVAGLAGGAPPSGAGENPSIPGTAVQAESPEAAIKAFLRLIQTRDRAGVLARLTEEARDRFGGDDPRILMNTLRLTRHALYDHDHYLLLEPSPTPVSSEVDAHQIRRIQLFDRDGGVTLALLRLVRDSKGTWRVDGLTLVAGTDQRGA